MERFAKERMIPVVLFKKGERADLRPLAETHSGPNHAYRAARNSRLQTIFHQLQKEIGQP